MIASHPDDRTPGESGAAELRSRVDVALPSMSLDPAAVQELGQRRVRRRTVGVAAGSVVACAAVVGLVAGVAGEWFPSTRSPVAAAPSTPPTSNPSPTPTPRVAKPLPVALAPGVVAADSAPEPDELDQIDLGTWRGVPVWLENGELQVQADDVTDGGVEADRGGDDPRVELFVPGKVGSGVFVWGTTPHDDREAVPYFWTTAPPAGAVGDGPLVVRVPTFTVPGQTGDPNWALGVFGSHLDVSDTQQVGVVFLRADGSLASPVCANLGSRTCMDPLPTGVVAAVERATGARAAPSSGTGAGHADPDTRDRKIEDRAASLMEAMSDALGDGDESENDPGVDQYWRGLDRTLDTLVTDAEQQGFSRGDHDARVVELGFFPYPDFLHERSAEWMGWVDGQRTAVTLDASGRVRYVGPSQGGKRVDVLLPASGAHLVDLVTHAYDKNLVGSVLGFTDAHGSDHHLDLITRAWLD